MTQFLIVENMVYIVYCKGGNQMVKHIVMWKLGTDNKEENAQKIKRGLEALFGKIEGLTFIEVGVNNNPSDMAFDIVLVSEFTDTGALESYQSNPLHVEVAQFVRSVVVDRKVVDYEINL